MNLPTTSSEITASWMTDALRASGVIGGDVAVAEIRIDPGAVGVGFMGEIATVGLTYDGEANGAPTSMIAKFPTHSPEVRAMMQPARIYEREHRFYREIAASRRCARRRSSTSPARPRPSRATRSTCS